MDVNIKKELFHASNVPTPLKQQNTENRFTFKTDLNVLEMFLLIVLNLSATTLHFNVNLDNIHNWTAMCF